MSVNQAHSAYQANSISTSKPEELTLMLYNGLVRFITQGIKAIEEKNTEKANENILRAEDIIVEFQVTLDSKYEIAQNLLLLYDYMHRRLIDANIKKDKQILEEVLRFAKELRNTWEQAMKVAREQSQLQQKAK